MTGTSGATEHRGVPSWAPPIEVVAERRPTVQPKLVLMTADLLVVAVAILPHLPRGQRRAGSAAAARFAQFAFATLPVWLGDLRPPAALQRPLHRPPHRRGPPHRQRHVPRRPWASPWPATSPSSTCPGRASSSSSSSSPLLVSIEREVARRDLRRAARARAAGPQRRHRRRQPRGPRAGRHAPAPTPGSATGCSASSTTTPPPTRARARRAAPRHRRPTPARSCGRRPGASSSSPPRAIESATTNRLARDLLDRGVHVELSSTLRDIASQRLIGPAARPLPGRLRRARPARRLAPHGQARLRPRRRRRRPRRSPARSLLACAIGHQARLPRPGALPPGPGRPQRPAASRSLKLRTMVADAEAQLRRAAGRQRGRRPAVQDARRPPHHPGRAASCARPRSTSCPSSWNVLRGEMSLVGPRPALPHETEAWDPLLHPAPAGHARHHRHVAGQRAQRVVVRGLHPPRPLLRRQLVAADRPGHPGQDGPRRPAPPGERPAELPAPTGGLRRRRRRGRGRPG